MASCFAVLGLLTLLAACGDSECVGKVYGGGDFTVRLSGALDSSISGDGTDVEWMDRRVKEVPQLRGDYPFGGVFADLPNERFFVGGVELQHASVVGCPDASFLGVWVESGYAKFNLFEDGSPMAVARGASTDLHRFEPGVLGSAWFQAEPTPLSGGCFMGNQTSADVDVVWELQKSTKEKFDFCGDDYFEFGGW